jgi:hypothetical protein
MECTKLRHMHRHESCYRRSVLRPLVHFTLSVARLLSHALIVAIVLLALPASAQGTAPDAGPGCGAGNVCGLDDVLEPALPLSGPDASAPVTLLFFWGVGCPHCEGRAA